MILTIKEAKLTRDTDAGSKMDPYCTVEINSIVNKTKVHDGAGNNPIWK